MRCEKTFGQCSFLRDLFSVSTLVYEIDYKGKSKELDIDFTTSMIVGVMVTLFLLASKS